jgi:hypothetical protein
MLDPLASVGMSKLSAIGEPGRGAPSRGLRALAHPVTIGAVALLVLNDHVLKGWTPGPLTGKLSDIAGLFFFPILATFLLGRLSRRWPARTVALAAFTLCAAGFALLKAHTGINSTVRELAASALGMHLQLALDPSDLWALLVMPPAFLLWLNAEGEVGRPMPVRRGLVMAAIASLAAIATSPCPPADPIGWLIDTPDGILAVSQNWESWSAVYRSTNAGQDWEYVFPEDEPKDLATWLGESPTMPLVACVPQDETTCYRIDGATAVVEASSDGGQTWQVAWRAPSARLSYMRRVAAGSGGPYSCGKELDLRPHEMIIVGEGADHVALIALGNEGVLRGRAGGSWERIGVGYARATPEQATSLDVLWPPTVVRTETYLLLLCGAIGFLLLSRIAWANVPRLEGASGRGWGWIWGLVAGVVILAGLLMIWKVGLSFLIPYVLAPIAGLLIYLAGLTQRWAIVWRDSQDKGAAWRALGLSLVASWGSAALAWIPLGLWMLGVIPWYEPALALSVLLVTLPMIAAGRNLRRPPKQVVSTGAS